jgi:mevalonate pyrophosphate decarboxylase
MILEGADPGIVEGDKARLSEIVAVASASGVFSLLKAYDEAKAQKKAIDDKADKAFRKYRDARVDLLMQRVKTDRAVVKARDGMEAAIESVISVYTAAETALGALRGVFTRPDIGE